VRTIARRGARAALAAGALILAGCATSPPAALEGRIWDARAGQFIDEGALLARLRAARYRLLGEVHDHPEHHRARASLIRGMRDRAEVFFEQFDRERDASLRQAQAAGADADGLARAGALDTKAWAWPLHRPLLEAAIVGAHPVRAANLSREDARRIARAGALAPPDAALARTLGASDWTEAREQALRKTVLDSHCGMLPAKVAPAMALAQRARDAAMAQALLSASGPVVLVAGNGHVRRDLGVPLYLPGNAKVLSVGFVETRRGEAVPRAYDPGAYDYIWFTAPQPRPDPCEAFRKR